MMMTYTVHTDGGARGNPGPAAIGVVIEHNGKKIFEQGKTIGEATNNVAEYTGVKFALEYFKEKFSDRTIERGSISFFLDSLLVVNQLNGIFKIKDSTLRVLFADIQILISEVGESITFHHVPREKNARADELLNRALDAAHYG